VSIKLDPKVEARIVIGMPRDSIRDLVAYALDVERASCVRELCEVFSKYFEFDLDDALSVIRVRIGRERNG
jgi:hypothetical protein